MTTDDVMLVCPACRTVLRTPDVDPTLSLCPKCGGEVLDKWSADGRRPLGAVHTVRPSMPRGWVVEEGVTLVVRHRSLLYRRQIELAQGRLRIQEGYIGRIRAGADVEIAKIREIHQKDFSSEGDDVTITSDLIALLEDGSSQWLIRGISPAAAFWLKDLLEVRLGISVIEPYRVDP